MTESIQTYMCVLCQEEKHTWAIINHSPSWRKEFTFLKNDYLCRACVNLEGIGSIFVSIKGLHNMVTMG